MVPVARPRAASRFRPAPVPDDPAYSAVPDEGLCLNVFLLVSPASDPTQVLFGQVDPRAPWMEIGAIGGPRLEALAGKWMLPSRHLFVFESPQSAAATVAREQLELTDARWAGPHVFSEAWERSPPSAAGPHWDLHFVFRGVWPEGKPRRARPWSRLEFLDPASLTSSEVGRGHLDVVALVDLKNDLGRPDAD